jgi:indolepyruvate ferredoxin oxidoreductase beta subunit
MTVKCDIILAGVGGQGVLSLAGIIASSAMEEKLGVKQSEVHGMSQRGGAVMAHLRISDSVIASDLIPQGKADLILSMEPVESLRYLPYLQKEGTLITATTPVLNIPDYPPIEELLAAIRSLPHAILVDTARLARQAGSLKSANMVLIGCASPHLPIRRETIERFVDHKFQSKGADVVEANRKAFAAGRLLADGAASQSA